MSEDKARQLGKLVEGSLSNVEVIKDGRKISRLSVNMQVHALLCKLAVDSDDERAGEREGNGKKSSAVPVGPRHEVGETCKSSSIVSFLRHGRHRTNFYSFQDSNECLCII